MRFRATCPRRVFLDNHKGAIELTKMEVMALVDGDLPTDSIDQLVSIG
jgi:hypothetical protein